MIVCGESTQHHNHATICKNKCFKCKKPLYNNLDEDGNHLGMVCMNPKCKEGPKKIYIEGRFIGIREPTIQKFPKEMKNNDW